VNGLYNAFQEDLKEVCRLLPPNACHKLQSDTHFWINKSISFGPKRSPIRGTTCTFHPGRGWLEKMGMNSDKAGGIEIYSAANYIGSRKLWGVGGLLLHELCHAYHYKHCEGSYDCIIIRDVSLFIISYQR
jgi:hypothetical protein